MERKTFCVHPKRAYHCSTEKTMVWPSTWCCHMHNEPLHTWRTKKVTTMPCACQDIWLIFSSWKLCITHLHTSPRESDTPCQEDQLAAQRRGVAQALQRGLMSFSDAWNVGMTQEKKGRGSQGKNTQPDKMTTSNGWLLDNWAATFHRHIFADCITPMPTLLSNWTTVEGMTTTWHLQSSQENKMAIMCIWIPHKEAHLITDAVTHPVHLGSGVPSILHTVLMLTICIAP